MARGVRDLEPCANATFGPEGQPQLPVSILVRRREHAHSHQFCLDQWQKWTHPPKHTFCTQHPNVLFLIRLPSTWASTQTILAVNIFTDSLFDRIRARGTICSVQDKTIKNLSTLICHCRMTLHSWTIDSPGKYLLAFLVHTGVENEYRVSSLSYVHSICTWSGF